MKKFLAGLIASVFLAQALAANVTPLDRYLQGLQTLRVNFTQTLVDSRGRKLDAAGGTLIVSRPGKFRWEIKPAASHGSAGQLLVADGRNLWFFDRDLEQVTVKPVQSALSATPALLLSGSTDVRDAFKISEAGQREGLKWVMVEPKANEADFRGALLGFGQGELKKMILEDKLGQTATVVFENAVRNGPVKPQEVSFKPPVGADVIGTPLG